MVVGAPRLVTDIWMAAKHIITNGYSVINIMNKVTRRKLGITQSDADIKVSGVLQKLTEKTPISLNVQTKDYTSYSNLDLKSVNLGTLRKPKEQIAIFDAELKAYIPLEISKNVSKPIYFAEAVKQINLTNGEVYNYQTDYQIDRNNPYDPIFSSFDRLYSLPSQQFIQSGVTGLRIGDKEKFLNISSNFKRSNLVTLTGAGTDVNGIYVQTNEIVNGRPRFINNSILYEADITWNTGISGWLLKRAWSPGNINVHTLQVYFLTGSPDFPTGQWSVTGSRAPRRPNPIISGLNPAPRSQGKELEGFFKLAQSRKSAHKAYVYAVPVGLTGFTVNETTGTLPLNARYVPYPHTYNIEAFTALRYPVSLVFASNGTGFKDLIIVSTGAGEKHIIYVSPHTPEQFQGFWSEQNLSDRSGDYRFVWRLASGNLLSITSENIPYTGLSSVTMSGMNSGEFLFDAYNYETSKLKQTTPLSQTLFYKLYEPVYKKNGINTGTWNGIIPSGVPFQIETLRTKNSEVFTPRIEVHIDESFVNISPSGSGLHQFIKDQTKDFTIFGSFYGRAINKSFKSEYEAIYVSENTAKSRAKAKLRGYLWEKGITVNNNKVRKTISLFQRGNIEKPRYCLQYVNPSDPLSCSYTGQNRGILGIRTNHGIRIDNSGFYKNSDFIKNYVDEDGNVIKFAPIVE